MIARGPAIREKIIDHLRDAAPAAAARYSEQSAACIKYCACRTTAATCESIGRVCAACAHRCRYPWRRRREPNDDSEARPLPACVDTTITMAASPARDENRCITS